MSVSFNADPAMYRQDNSYVISRQGKPPDLVMEIATERTGRNDVEDKPGRYAALGIPEYWRFDESGDFHGAKLAGDRLVQGRYEPIPIEEVEEGIFQGYRAALGLFIRWEHGQLRWHDPETGQEIPTFEQERVRGTQRRKPKHRPRRAGWPPRHGSESWRRSWRGGTKGDRKAPAEHQRQFAKDQGSTRKLKTGCQRRPAPSATGAPAAAKPR